VRDAAWCRNPIDRFILARLEKEGLRPSPEADALTLVRRMTFDLTGLPPTPEEVDEFVKASSAKPQAAYEELVDRLLASPHYGERWGRHWLDLARYADSNGYEFDELRPDAWRYRDYVIRSLNADKPFDRFAKEQLAGDELWPDDPQALVATGFNLLGPDMTDSADQKQRRLNTLNDMTDTAGLVFMGLTVACARCHDHKFEPIPIEDYYRFQAFFAPAKFRSDLPVGTPEQKAAFQKAKAEYDALVKPVLDDIAKLEEPYRQKLYKERVAKLADAARDALNTPAEKRTPAQQELVEQSARFLVVPADAVAKALSEADKARHQELQAKLKSFDSRKPTPLPTAMGLSGGPAVKTFVLDRGELKNPGDEVRPGYPTALTTEKSAGTRAALAEWLTKPGHPLTARVIVNRLWQHHFGRGLVATPSDFGLRGSDPTHPELLDWLALELIDGGWSLKRIHRLMLTSATYRQASAGRRSPEADPDNLLLWRMNRQRLEGEAVRDALLAVSGRLSYKMGGPGVMPPLPADAGTVKGWTVSPDKSDHVRRSVYVLARRNLRFAFLEAFDLPDSNLSCPRRERSTTAPQALALLNSQDVVEAAKATAARVKAAGGSDDEQVTRTFRLILGRPPSVTEAQAAREFLKQSPPSELCRALMNVNEFAYVD
jgi:hypothetical protein